MEEKHSQSPKNEGKDKRKENIIIDIFKKFKELPKDLKDIVPYIILFIIYLFLFPYFKYFKLSFMDIIPINTNPLPIFILLFIFIVIVLYLTFILAPPGIVLYLSLYYYNVKTDLNLKEFLRILWFSKELLRENLFSWILLCFTSLFVALIIDIDFSSLPITILTIPFIRFIVDLIYYYALKTYNKLSTKKDRLNTDYNLDNDFFHLGQSYVGFTSFLFISALVLLFFSARDVKSILTFIIALSIFVFMYYAIFIFLVLIRSNITIKLFLTSIIIVIIVSLKLLASLYEQTYIHILFIEYSLFGLASNKNIVLIKKDICDNLPSEICEKLKSFGRNENAKNKNYLCSENIKDYICLEDVKIIWNGSDKIFVSVDDDSLVIPIPKDYLLNKDFIRKRDNDKTGNDGINNKTHNLSSNSQARNENGGNPSGEINCEFIRDKLKSSASNSLSYLRGLKLTR